MTTLTQRFSTGFRRVAVRAYLLRQTHGQRLVQHIKSVGDRGEGPVSTAIMVALIAGVAVLVGGIILAVAQGWTDKIPREAP